MRKEVDELKSAMKDKGGENLDGMIQRTDLPFTNEVLNCPLLPKFCLPQLESYDSSKYPLDHIKSFKMLILLQMTPNEVMCRAFPTTLKGAAKVWFSKTPKNYCRLQTTQQGFCLSFHWGAKTQKTNWPSSQNSASRRRITKIVRHSIQ